MYSMYETGNHIRFAPKSRNHSLVHAPDIWTNIRATNTQSIECSLTSTVRQAPVGAMGAEKLRTSMIFIACSALYQRGCAQSLTWRTELIIRGDTAPTNKLSRKVERYEVMRAQDHYLWPMSRSGPWNASRAEERQTFAALAAEWKWGRPEAKKEEVWGNDSSSHKSGWYALS